MQRKQDRARLNARCTESDELQKHDLRDHSEKQKQKKSAKQRFIEFSSKNFTPSCFFI